MVGHGWACEHHKRRIPLSLEIIAPDLVTGRTIFLRWPSPLFLYNTRRAAKALSDVTVVAPDGDLLDCGTVNWDRDDGSSCLWIRLGEEELVAGRQTLYLYCDGPPGGAKPAEKPPGPDSTGYKITVLPEERRDAVEPDPSCAEPGRWFKDFLPMEAEGFKIELPAKCNLDPNASAGGLVALNGGKLNADFEFTPPGAVKLWIRTRNTEALSVALDGKPLGIAPAKGKTFSWSSADADLTPGKHSLTLAGTAEVDALLVSRNPDYIPDYRDFTGPVWMRVNVLAPATQRKSVAAGSRTAARQREGWSASFYAVHTPYSAEGMLGKQLGTAFSGLFVSDKAELEKLRTPPLLEAGEWSPWVEMIHSTAYTWHVVLTVAGKPAAEKLRIEFATAPHSSRVFAAAEEVPNAAGQVSIRMPTSLAFDSLGMTQTFRQWAESRFKQVESAGFRQGEGPKKMFFCVWADSFDSRYVAEMTLKIFSWIGFNGVCSSGPDDATFGELCEKAGIQWTFYNDWCGGAPDYKALETAADTEKALADAFAAAGDAFFEAAAEAHKKRDPWYFAHCRYSSMGDEIGPIYMPESINGDKRVLRAFREFLKKCGATPETFKKKSWDEVFANDFAQRHPKWVMTQARIKQATEAQAETAKRFERLAQSGGEAVEELVAVKETEREKQKEDDLALEEDDKKQATEEKDPKVELRLWYYTQRFRSFATALFYRGYSQGFMHHYPPGAKCTPNFQASPAQCGQMWDGALDLFDFGRYGSAPVLHVEDYVVGWDFGAGQAAFMAALLRGAASWRKLDRGSYICGGQVRSRTMAMLSEGHRYFCYYIYGPIHRIGPVWAEDFATIQDMAKLFREVARCEDDILRATNAPSKAALLVASSSEIMTTFGAAGFGAARQEVFIALRHAGIPLDIIGEQHILDGYLENYAVLYLVDPNIRRDVLAKIRAWVEAGGRLWVGLGAGLRDEFNEPCELLCGDTARQTLAVEELKKPIEASGTDFGTFQVAGKRGVALEAAGEVVAKFEDGKPAIVRTRCGKGEMLYVLFAAGSSYFGKHYAKWGEDGGVAERNIIASLAQKYAPPPFELSQKGLHATLHLGDGLAVLYLVNCWFAPADSFKAAIELPFKPATVYNAKGNLKDWKWENGTLTVNLPLCPDSDIVVAKR